MKRQKREEQCLLHMLLCWWRAPYEEAKKGGTLLCIFASLLGESSPFEEAYMVQKGSNRMLRRLNSRKTRIYIYIFLACWAEWW
jgi:hypothetical protein